MIRSSRLSLKFSNKTKLFNLGFFIDEYKRVVSLFIDDLWNDPKIPALLPKEKTAKIESWLSSRAIQCAGKQASASVRSVKRRQDKRLFVIDRLKKEGKFKQARKLQKIFDNTKTSKPFIKNIECELDSRFLSLDFESKNSFDGWISLTSLGNKVKLVLPVRKTKHFNSLFSKHKLLSGFRLSKTGINFNFELQEMPPKTSGECLGIDIGAISVISCSNGYQSPSDIHGHTLGSILEKMSRKKRGSKAYFKAKNHRDNFIKNAINNLNLNSIKEIRIEKIKNLRRNRKTSKILSLWNYTDIFSKIKSRSQELGVQVVEIAPTYTSQRCSCCGWTRKVNRKGIRFKCEKCGNSQNSDLNAARNISFNLTPIKPKERKLHKNRKGFYWNVIENSV